MKVRFAYQVRDNICGQSVLDHSKSGVKVSNPDWQILYFVLCVGQRYYDGPFSHTNILRECSLKD